VAAGGAEDETMKNDDDLEKTATAAIHKAAMDYCDGLVDAGENKRDAALKSMGRLVGEAALIAYTAGLTADGFCQVAETLFEQAATLAKWIKKR
jgi:hypothetical protein